MKVNGDLNCFSLVLFVMISFCIPGKGKAFLLPRGHLAARYLTTIGGTNDKSDNFLDNLGDLLDQNAEKKKELSANGHSSKINDNHNDGWRRINWRQQFDDWLLSSTISTTTEPEPSPVQRILIRNRLVYFKRDDQIKLQKEGGGAPVAGNKARKMIALHQILTEDFPSCVVSYGGPQSNAMLALAAIVHFQNEKALQLQQPSNNINTDNHNDNDDDDENTQQSQQPQKAPIKRFVYYTKKLPRFLRQKPNGNLFRAQALGMELVELSPQEYGNLFGGEWGGPSEPPPLVEPPVLGDSLWIPQGGACGLALQGTFQLAQEIATFWTHQGRGRPLTVCIPGGTCSTAALVSSALHDILSNDDNNHNMEMDIRVVVIPCVGDETYAQRQMMSLLSDTTYNNNIDDNSDDALLSQRMPTVLAPFPDDNPRYFGQSDDEAGYFRFGEPHAEILDTFREMKERFGVVLDLLFGAPSWKVLLRHFRTERSSSSSSSSFDPKAPLAGREIMYVHSGGLEGIVSQLNRYLYKGLVDIEEVQLPGRP